MLYRKFFFNIKLEWLLKYGIIWNRDENSLFYFWGLFIFEADMIIMEDFSKIKKVLYKNIYVVGYGLDLRVFFISIKCNEMLKWFYIRKI